ncbi:translocase of outer mitochondrial membrane [Mucor velutinosus]|uniref:Translocase of outer mitochondrial membrane n=1 Tax=Mucor velutinosus TaxID=708070 RepID=A0AAN7DSW6_9FUNG|nr:translocase of outer mitochondrial membrane [Mucor velutinosus]
MNYPEADSVYKIGDTMLIEWYTKESSLMAPPVTEKYATIVLAYGQRDNLTIDRIMTTKSDLSLGFYQWIIPTTVESRTDYVIEVGTDASNIAFAGYITINRRSLVVAATTTTTAASSVATHKALGLS